MENVVDRDHPDQAAVIIDHGGRDQIIFLETQGNFFLVHVDRDQRLLALHDIGDGNVARGPQDPAQLAGADRAESRIDHVDFPEFGGQVVILAQIVDQVADHHMFGHRDKFALHDAAGGFLLVGEGALDRGAILGIQFRQDRLLLALFEILDDRDRVIGVELFGQVGNLAGIERLDHVLADMLVHLGEHVGADQIAKRFGQRRALVGTDQLEQIGDVGIVERVDQFLRQRAIIVLDRLGNRADKFVGQPVVLVEDIFPFDVGIWSVVDLGHRDAPLLRLFGCLLVVATLQMQSFVTIIPRQGDFSERLAYMRPKNDSTNEKEPA